MASINPFANDPALGEAWEMGYLAGFAQPEEDHFLPLAPQLLDAYQQGDVAGRDDRRLLPPDGGVPADGFIWNVGEAAGDLSLHALGHVFGHLVFKAAGGLIATVLLVLQIPTDSPMQPLDDDWTGPPDEPNDQYVALCSRSDHLGSGLAGVTAEGYWCGPGRTSLADAVADVKGHPHAETGIARCSQSDGTCGLVRPGSGP